MKKLPTMREINASKDKMLAGIRKRRSEWDKKNPGPSCDEYEEWKAKHPSPRAKHDALRDKVLTQYVEESEAILYDARMGILTPDELYAKVKAFCGE